MTSTTQLREKEFDQEDWQKLYYKTQKQYLRQRLQAIKHVWTGKSRSEVAAELGVYRDTITDWIKLFLKGNYDKLLSPVKHPSRSPLTEDQRAKLKQIIITTKPYDNGIDRNIRTGEIIGQIIKKEFGIELKKQPSTRILTVWDYPIKKHTETMQMQTNLNNPNMSGY